MTKPFGLAMGARGERKTLKARQILDGAKAAFLELGFSGASVDEIARRAGVSKATVYVHFADKAKLFQAVVEDEANAAKAWLSDLDAEVGADDGQEPRERARALIRRIVDRFIQFLLTPLPQALYRIVLAESGRFPELGRMFYEHGPAAGRQQMAEVLRAASRAGLLAVEDPDRAAKILCSLCDGDLVMRFRMLGEAPTDQQILDAVEQVVEVFLRVYGRSPEGSSTRLVGEVGGAFSLAELGPATPGKIGAARPGPLPPGPTYR